MLCSISIRDLAVVESLELDLPRGLTVLTGETGAGKSILLTAMGLALGDRADSGFIRPGSDKAEINLQFDLSGCHGALAWLTQQELADDCTLIVRRILNSDGRSKAFINGSAVNLQMLQQLGENLIDIHGQHAHLSLMHREEQCRILDQAAGNQNLLDETTRLYQEWSKLGERLRKERERSSNAQQRLELAGFQIREMEQCDIENLDYRKLVDEHALAANLEKVLSTGQAQLDRLQDNDYHSINSLLGETIRALSEFSGIAAEFGSIVELLDDARIQVQESARLLGRYLDSLEIDPGRLEALDQRLSILHNLARKHQTTPENLAAVLHNLREEMQRIEHGAENITQIETRLDQIHEQYLALAQTVSDRRKQAAVPLQDKITRIIRELGMPQGEFRIELQASSDPCVPKSKGFDLVEFCVTTNPGLPARPLGKIASGGELSRISLALQVAAIDSNTTPTMVFDEVDSGIGGGVAEIVGQRLRALGNSRQVFCITHLPQVAAQSHHHLLVEKISPEGQTRSIVRALTSDQRRAEIARMLGGVKITDQTLAHAREMLEWTDNPAENP
ncbi:MAG: DNA repair protein RecN [Methylococcaceae bacterium]|nr:DNA repair protein RecN [Methylococcaceae bacterium]